jgi:hypothetical protein
MSMILSSQSTEPITAAQLLGEEEESESLEDANQRLDRMLQGRQKRLGEGK